MRTILALTILLGSFLLVRSDKIHGDYIEIRHTGMSEKPVKTLLLSREKLTIDIDKNDPLIRLLYKKNINRKQMDSSVGLRYDLLITNERTLTTIKKIVRNNQAYFVDSNHKNHGSFEDYAVVVNRKTYNIYYKQKKQFFSDLKAELIQSGCDQKVIAKLMY